MSIADRIAEITQRLGDIQGQGIRDQGNIQAQAIANSGQIWSQAISNLGQLPGQVFGQMRQMQTVDLENQQRQLQITALKTAAEGQQRANAVIAGLPKNPDGTYDPSALVQQLAQKNVPLQQQEALVKSIDGVNGVIKGFNQTRTDHAADLANVLLSQKRADQPITPDAVHLGMAAAVNAGLASQQEADQLTKAIGTGADPELLLKQIRSMGSKYQDKPVVIPRGGVLANPSSGQVIAQGQAEPLTEPEIAMRAAAGDPAKAIDLLKGGTGKDDQRYEQIQQAAALKQPVSPEDRAWASAYERRKTLGPEATAAAAADRQALTIAQQTAQQARTQSFAEAQAGRKELTEKVEQPYQDAVEKASTLRSVVDAAKNGNMEAANVQSLMGTLGLVTMEGVKRINTTELNQVAGAGSLLERIKSQVGGLVAGKPLSPRLQQDLVQLSGLLEQSARQKYESGFKQVTTRYGLKDEQVMPSGGGTAAAGPQEGETKPIPGYPGTEQTFKGGKWIRTK